MQAVYIGLFAILALGITGYQQPALGTELHRIASIDTMKESRDTATRPLTIPQIENDVNLCAMLHVTHITVDTEWDYPEYMQKWITAIRATGKHIWFRGQPVEWGQGKMSPAQFETAERAFILSHAYFFQKGDIFDPLPEPENSPYWKRTYGENWTYNAPNTATRAYNNFLRDTTQIANTTFRELGITGVTTGIRSTNQWIATHILEPETVVRLGYVTIDSYPEENSISPDFAAKARFKDMEEVVKAWPGTRIIIGEMGYSNNVPVNDEVQNSVLKAELQTIQNFPTLAGINYWVGAGTNTSGGYTHVFSGTAGEWTLRPAASALEGFYDAWLTQ